MQIYMPYDHVERSSRVLDAVSLLNQIQDARKIILHNDGRSMPEGDPLLDMWKGYSLFLAAMGFGAAGEAINRGISIMGVMSLTDYRVFFELVIRNSAPVSEIVPSWYGRDELHRSHRALLLKKDPIAYQRFKEEDSSLRPSSKVWWPTVEDQDAYR